MDPLKGVPLEKDWDSKKTCAWLVANVPNFKAEARFLAEGVAAEHILSATTLEELAHKLRVIFGLNGAEIAPVLTHIYPKAASGPAQVQLSGPRRKSERWNRRESVSSADLQERVDAAVRGQFELLHALAASGVTPSKRIDVYKSSKQFVFHSSKEFLPSLTPSKIEIGKHFTKRLPHDAKEKEAVQPMISDLIPELNLELSKAGAPLRLMDTHAKVTFNNRKPDIVVYPATQVTDPAQLPSAYFIVLVGDVKGRRPAAKFSDEELGELEVFLSELLEMFPRRTSVIGFLTDGDCIQFMRLHRLPRKINYTEELLLHGDGARYLMAMLCATPAVLGADVEPITVNGHSASLSEFLGSGSSGVVWKGHYPTCTYPVVVKIFSESRMEDYEAELANLHCVQQPPELVNRVPRLEASDDGSRVLVLSPVGKPFASSGQDKRGDRPYAHDFQQLLWILRKAHEVGLVHRDLAPQNFFRNPITEEVFLNDWGSAAKVATRCSPAGALRFYPTNVLRDMREAAGRELALEYIVHAWHDLEMLVKVMYFCTHWDDRIPSLGFRGLDASKLAEYWENAVQSWDAVDIGCYPEAFAAARKCDYNKLAQLIPKLCLVAEPLVRQDNAVCYKLPPAAVVPVEDVSPAIAPAKSPVASDDVPELHLSALSIQEQAIAPQTLPQVPAAASEVCAKCRKAFAVGVKCKTCSLVVYCSAACQLSGQKDSLKKRNHDCQRKN